MTKIWPNKYRTIGPLSILQKTTLSGVLVCMVFAEPYTIVYSFIFTYYLLVCPVKFTIFNKSFPVKQVPKQFS